MASIILLKNPLSPHTREIHAVEAGLEVIDWLQENHPKGFGMPLRFYLNGEETPLDDLDHKMDEDDVAVLALMPGDPSGGLLTAFAINFAISLVLAAAGFAINYFFQPKQVAGAKAGTSVKVYDVSGDQNAAKLGSPIPVIYGDVVTTPDYISQPYTWFSFDQSSYNEFYSGVQYLDMILCVGQGDIDVENVYLSNTASTLPAAGVVTWQAFKPAQHNKTMGVIASAMGNRFHENVISSPEVGNQELANRDETIGPFALCKPGNQGSKFQVDVVFPAGQTDPDSTGDVKGRATNFNIIYYQIDDNDNRISSDFTKTIRVRTVNNSSADNQDSVNVTITPGDEKNKTIIQSPLRRSYMITTPYSARWAVKIIRTTPEPDLKSGQDRFIVSGLKLYADYPAGSVYGDVTLLAVRVKASIGLGTEAASRITVRCKRRLPPPGGGAQATSTNGADAFADIFTNAVYGADRPRSELDTAVLTQLRSEWGGYQFNHVFTERTTVWEALRTVTTPFAAEPSPVGAVMSVAQDGVKATRSMLFTDANIVADSLVVSYSFDDDGASDGVEIEYVNPADFRKSYVVYPDSSLRPDQFSVDGITSAAHAQQYARLTWQRRSGQRKKVAFDTELEGLILQLGDRIGISHNVMKWGDGGLIVGQDALTLTSDHDLDWSGGVKQIILRRQDGSASDPITVTQGAQPNLMVMASGLNFPVNIDNDYEYTSFAFGEPTTLVRDFIVTTVRPNGENTVSIEAVNYAPNIYVGGMSFLS
jgi:hypothetical protein